MLFVWSVGADNCMWVIPFLVYSHALLIYILPVFCQVGGRDQGTLAQTREALAGGIPGRTLGGTTTKVQGAEVMEAGMMHRATKGATPTPGATTTTTEMTGDELILN